MSRVLVLRPVCAGKWAAFLSPSLILLSTFGYPSAPARAEQPKTELVQEAAVLVRHALDAEAEGRASDRDELLQWALEKVPGFAPALWHRGFVRFDNKWTKADDVPRLSAAKKDLATYNTLRQRYPQTADGQLRLAHWCAQHGLGDQERAHLTKVLELDSNNADVRKRLRFVFLDGLWRSEQEIRAAAAQADRTAASLKKWSPRLQQVVRILDQTNGRSAGAANRVHAIKDPEAVPALEAALGNLNEPTALLLIDVLSMMDSPEASLALARLAVTTHWTKVKEAAADTLKSRPEEEYIPALLSALSGPLQSKSELYQTPDGRLIYNHAFYREAQDHQELAVFQTSFQQVDVDPGQVTVTYDQQLVQPTAAWRRAAPLNALLYDQRVEELRRKAISEAQTASFVREAVRNESNAQLDAQNRLVCDALAMVTGQVLPPIPDAWWQWWNDYNEVVTDPEKPLQEGYQFDGVGMLVMAPPPPPRSLISCLPAGTLVWTATGAAAIEQIKIGDLVLAQDPATGELGYKPVLRTTFRPAAKLVKFRAGKYEIQSTPGHTFWVDGSGWVRVRQLEAGARLHAVSGTVLVENTQQTDLVAPVFNLVVADFHSYFVGNERVLSHDITSRQSTAATPFGLPRGSTGGVERQKSSH